MELCFMSNLSSSEWASWVQALGALLALFVAVLVGYCQARAARELQAEIAETEHRRQLRHAAALLSGSNEVVEGALLGVELALGSAYGLPLNGNRVRHALDVLKQAVTLPMPGPAVLSLMRARATLAELLDLIDGVSGKIITENSGVAEMVGKIREVMQQSAREIEAELDQKG